MKPDYRIVVAELRVFDILSRYGPGIAGTPPLGIAVPDSDIDILCHVESDAWPAFTATLWQAWSGMPAFRLRQWTGGERPLVASFEHRGWVIEIFGHPLPVERQVGMRHFQIERRLLQLGGEGLRAAVIAAKRDGVKTEPAFAALLGLAGDPYESLLALEALPDAVLLERIAGSTFRTPPPALSSSRT